MTLTAKIKEELTQVDTGRASCRSAEVSVMIRLAGSLNLVAGKVVIEVWVDAPVIARRLASELEEQFGCDARVEHSPQRAVDKSAQYLVSVDEGGEEIARRTGLIDRSGRPVRGLPPMVVSGTIADAEAAWRGAFLAQGLMTEPGRSSSLEIVCSCPEVALALVGCARRMGVAAKSKEVRGTDRVIIRDNDAIGALLSRMGAHASRLEWDELSQSREGRSPKHRLANFDDANMRRSARAAVTAAARVERALEILGDEVPDHLLTAGQLRTQHRQASLEELGQIADPPMTKDAVAGRIRRLLSMADRRAEELGIPDTNAAVTPELMDEI